MVHPAGVEPAAYGIGIILDQIRAYPYHNHQQNLFLIILLYGIVEEAICFEVGKLFAAGASRKVFTVGLRNLFAKNKTKKP